METEIKIHIAAVIVGFFLDLWIGDPERWPHPVRAMGWLIGRLEGMFRKISPKTPACCYSQALKEGPRWAGEEGHHGEATQPQIFGVRESGWESDP